MPKDNINNRPSQSRCCKPAGHPATRLLWLLLLACLLPHTATAQNSVRFSCAFTPDSERYQYLLQLYNHTFKQLGHSFQMQQMPPLREQAAIDEGRIDGICARADWPGQGDPAPLQRVDLVVMTSRMQAWGTTPDIRVDYGLEGLENYRIGYAREQNGLEQTLRANGVTQLQPLERAQLGLRQLSQQRLDIYLDQEYPIEQALQTEPELRQSIHLLKEFPKFHAYPFLHPRFQPLLEDFKRELELALEQFPAPGSLAP